MPRFREVGVGTVLPPLVCGPVTRQMLVEWCAAESDYYPIHYDERLAKRMGLPGVPIQGTYRYALMGQLLAGWHGEEGALRSIEAEHRGISLEDETLTVRGRVVALHPEEAGGCVDVEVSVTNADGTVVRQGRLGYF